MEHLSFLSETETAISIATNVAKILGVAIAQTSSISRSGERLVEQLHHEVEDTRDVLQRLKGDVSEYQIEVAVFESQTCQTSHIGNHWEHILRLLLRLSEELQELKDLLENAVGGYLVARSRPMKTLGTQFLKSDIEYYREEIKKSNYTIVLLLQTSFLSRCMDSMTVLNASQPSRSEIELTAWSEDIETISVAATCGSDPSPYTDENATSPPTSTIWDRSLDTVSQSDTFQPSYAESEHAITYPGNRLEEAGANANGTIFASSPSGWNDAVVLSLGASTIRQKPLHRMSQLSDCLNPFAVSNTPFALSNAPFAVLDTNIP
ncbi:hypothetical protein BT63DRAFT_453321 [Microthyrium microscopicum]|uniref:Fungal N-terminal domain-containing protein n=1 Tax=Microthyrium microscopicum TaxID=703497 RepID=A0A6A6UGK8_9PEZI|nr:hypothetical protein BT63DRAFT_453321 [Microthyrium microscopicum]